MRKIDRPTWHDVYRAGELLDGDRCLLLLLVRLPFLWQAAIRQLYGVARTSISRRLERLESAGLVTTIQPPFKRGHSPQLYHPTDLGLAVVGLHLERDHVQLAKHLRLRRADLLACLPRLPHLLANYELLVHLAASQPGTPRLLAWERPWHRRFRSPSHKDEVTITAPIYTTIAWDGGEAVSAFLVPDLTTVPLDVYHPLISGLQVFREAIDGDAPPLLIVTQHEHRAIAWRKSIEAVARQRCEVPLTAWITTWEALRTGLDPAAVRTLKSGKSIDALFQRVPLQPVSHSESGKPIRRVIGEPLAITSRGEPEGARLSRLALELTPTDRHLLDLIGRHPFLPSDSLAILSETNAKTLRQRRNRLMARGLLRLAGADEIGDLAKRELVELTLDGLKLAAAQQGLTLMTAVHIGGLAGGGPKDSVGTRPVLVKRLAHTLGTDAVFVHMALTARRRRAAGWDDELVEWQNRTVASRRHFRPAGYGIYRYHGRLHDFFLDYGRSTISVRDCIEKFATYYAYRDSRRYERDYLEFPTILYVTTDPRTEERILRTAAAAGAGRVQALPVLVTTWDRIIGDRDGLLGRIWLKPGSDQRCRWLVAPGLSPLAT